MRIFPSLLTSPRLFRWVGVGGVVCSLLFPLVAGSTSIWIMKNVTAGSEARQLAAHLRAELAEHLGPEDLQPPLSPKAISALDYLFHRSSLSRAENLKAIRLWSAEEKLLWSSRSGAGGSVPPPEAFREALRQGFTFRQIPPNTWYPAFQPKTSPLRLETWVALAGTEGEPPSSRFRFVAEVLSEPADLPAEVALYESRIWLISGSLGVAGLSLMLMSLSFLRRLHGTAARQAAHGMLTTKITRALSADLDPDRLFRNILQEIRQVAPCDRIVIAGVDPATREHRFWHVESDFSVPRFSGGGNREVGEWNLKNLYARMLPINFPDLEKADAPWVPYLLKGGLRSAFFMPILQEGAYFAHLGLSWARKGGVDAESEALLSSLAGHLASAIRNATLFQRAERRASRLATLNALSQKIAQNIDLRETLDAIVQAAVELLGGDIARAFLQDEETGVLVPQAHAGRIPPPSAPLGTLRVGRGVIGRIVESGEPAILPDVQEVPEWQLNDWARENGLRSYVAHPFRLGGKPFGAIYCISTKAGFFTREDLDLLGSFSFQASIAIEKARLFAETRQRALRLELAGEITKALASTLRPGELFRTIAREIRRAVPCERCVIGSLDRESHRYHTWHAESEVELPVRDQAFDDEGTWWDRDVYESMRMVSIPDIRPISYRRAQEMADAGLRSVLVMPILQDGKSAAHIFLASVRPANFTRDHERLLASLSDHLGMALRNAMLYQASEDKTSRLEITGEIAKAVSSSLEPEDIFRTITREIRRAIPCGRCVIATVNEAATQRIYWHVDSDAEVNPLSPEKHAEVSRRLRRQVYEGKRPFYIPDIVGQRGAEDRLAKAGFRSTLIVPILQGDRCVAHLSVSSTRVNGFTWEHESLLASVAAHVGPAIRNATLYRTAEERASRLEITGEIAKAVSSSLEPEEIFRTITREIRRAMPCERCAISTVDPQTAIPAYWHIDSDIEVEPLHPGQGTEAGGQLLEKVYARKEPYCIHDILQERGPEDRVARSGLRSALYIPILQGEHCVAHISALSTRPYAFTPEHQALLVSIAAHVGPAIRNATLYRTAEERASRLSVLNEVNREISGNIELDEVLESIARAVTTLLRAEHARIFMLGPDSQNLVLKAHHGSIPWPRERSTTLPPGVSLSSWVFENNQAALVADLRADPRWHPMPWEWLPQRSLLSAVCQPLIQGGRPIGVILGLGERKGAFSEQDLALLGDLASQASIAIEKARHFSAARERAARLGVLNQLNQKIIATHSLDEILNALIQASAELLKGEHVNIFLFDEAAGRLTLRASYGSVPEAGGRPLTLAPGEGVGGRVFETGVPANIPDVSQDPNWLAVDWARGWGLHSFICQPLTQRGRSIGVINCLSGKAGFFTDEDVNLLGALASQAAIAIEKTALLTQARERAARLEITGEIARALNSSLEPEQIFRIIVSEIRRAVPCERCVIASVDPATKAYQYFHIESDIPVPGAPPHADLIRGEWFHREVYQPGRPKFVPNLAEIRGEDVTPWSERLVKAGLRSLLIVPILQEGRCAAHLSLTALREDAFSRGQIDLLTSIAQHLGSAIRNASLYRTAEQRASRLLVLNRLNRHITENLALDETLGSIVHAVHDLLGGDHARLFLVDEGANRLVLRASHGKIPGPHLSDLSSPVGQGVIGHVAGSGEPALIADLQAEPRWTTKDWARENGVHSYIAQPLRQGGKIIGVLNCFSRKQSFFTPSDLELLAALASQAAIAVQNARLHDEEKRSREFLNSVVGDTSDPIIITSQDRTILLWNSGAEELYGYSESETLGRKIDFIVPEDDARQKGIVGRVTTEGVPVTYETRRRHKDGGLIPVTITLSPVQDERGAVVAIAGIHKDLSEWKRAERALQEAREEAEAANRAKSAFLSDLNHELRSPLNVVSGLSDILRLQAPDGETSRIAQRIREAGEHMLRLIEDLLDLDRISTGKLGLQPRDAAIDPLVRAAVEARLPHLPGGFTLEADLGAEGCQVRCDPTRIRQILINLLDNAVKYSPSGGAIRVRTERSGGEVWISVKDQGIGIGPEEARLIFQRFAQLESGGAHRGGGLGIGLHLVQQLLALQGGRIWVEGAKGAGSTFFFSLPLSPQAAPPAGAGNGEGALPAAGGEEPWEGASVLVLEGQVPIQGYLRMLMRNAGRLLSAHTEEEGLEAARKERPDLILVDLETPQAGGLRLLRRLKSLPETRGIPAVAVSSGGPGGEKEHCQGLGVEGFVSKPIDPAAFRLEISRVLSGRREKKTPPPSLSARGG